MIEFYDRSSLFTEFYDEAQEEFSRTRADVDFLVGKAEGRSVMEVGCGTGRVLFPMAEVASRAVGVDRSRPMLARARRRLAGVPHLRAKVALRTADATVDLGPGRFDLVVLACFTINHFLTDAAAVAVLRNVRRSMAPGGSCFVHGFTAAAVRVATAEIGASRMITTADGAVYSARTASVAFDPPSDVVTHVYEFEELSAPRGGRRAGTTERYVYTCPPDGRYERLFAAAGLAVRERLTNLGGKDLDHDAVWLLGASGDG